MGRERVSFAKLIKLFNSAFKFKTFFIKNVLKMFFPDNLHKVLKRVRMRKGLQRLRGYVCVRERD